MFLFPRYGGTAKSQILETQKIDQNDKIDSNFQI